MIFHSLLRFPKTRVAVGCAAVLLSTLYVAWSLNRGWIPHDEGQLGQTAERILSGELPHRDFIEPYTGGLGYLNALAFRLFGVRSEVLRWQMLPFFATFAGCIYFMAVRVVSPAAAAAVTFACACFTLPIYPAGMPSWYNLFAATCGTAALLQYLHSGRARWLILAGLYGGLSILIKITGLYFLAAAMFWLAFCEQQQSDSRDRRCWTFSIASSLALMAFGGLGLFFLRHENPLMDAVHFAVPFMGMAAIGIHNEWQIGRGEFRLRLLRLGKVLIPFCSGVAIPLSIFLIPYVLTDSIGDLLHGLFVLPARRLTARMSLPDLQWLILALPLAGLFAVGLLPKRPSTSSETSQAERWHFPTPLALAVCAVLVGLLAVSHTDRGYLSIFQAIRQQLPLLVMTALVMLSNACSSRLSAVRRQELLLLAAATFFISLIQFPYSGGFYFFYAAPLGVLLATYIVAFQPAAPRRLHAAVLAFVVLFLVLRMHHPGPAITGGPYAPKTQTESLKLERCHLIVRQDQARLYQSVIAAVQAHGGQGEYIYAAPDCPEVYFLAGRKSPTRSPYDLFDTHDDAGRIHLVNNLDRLGVKVVVLKRFSEFSTQFDPALTALLEQRFTQRESFPADIGGASGEAFVVLWRS